MSINITDFRVVDNTKLVEAALPETLEKLGEAIGLQAIKYAAMQCPVDTGLLRNSLAYALSGGQAAPEAYTADRPDKSGRSKKGTYSGHAPSAEKSGIAVYIGSNVEYAPDVEMGTRKTTAKPFLRPAIEEHAEEYKRIAKDILTAGGD